MTAESCRRCMVLQSHVTSWQGGLITAAKRAARNPSARNLADVDKAKAERDSARHWLAEHEREHDVEAAS